MNKEAQTNIKFLLDNVLSKHKIEDLAIMKYKRGDKIIVEGNPIDEVFFLISGKIKIYKDYENGKTLLIQFVKGLCLMGDVEYITDGDTATGTVEAVSDVFLVKLKYEDLYEKYNENNEFKDYLTKHVISRFMSSDSKIMINLIYSVDTRLASYILSMLGDDEEIFLTLGNLQDLSNNIGTSYRHLHRTFKMFVEDGLINKVGNKIEIINKPKIIELARGNVYEDSYEEKGI